ncbi:hypothetical protein [Neobacillus cucumis]|uniref:hypothetical protein n=1 Tax=Neobacillus cucumis TaxID=1740721 RepID=UPI0011587236|nr:hypothetical protein [Neobacillus cucumis]
MTHTITTGPHPGQTGGCMAQYNHYTLSHTPSHHSSSHNPDHNPNHNPNHINPFMSHPFSGQASYGHPSWRPPASTFPYYY